MSLSCGSKGNCLDPADKIFSLVNILFCMHDTETCFFMYDLYKSFESMSSI